MNKYRIYEFILGHRKTSLKEIECEIETQYCDDEKLQQILKYYLLDKKIDWEKLKKLISSNEESEYQSFFQELHFLEHYKFIIKKNKKYFKTKNILSVKIPDAVTQLIDLGEEVVISNDAFFVELYLANVFAMMGESKKAEETLNGMKEKNSEYKILLDTVFSQQERMRFSYYSRDVYLPILDSEIHGLKKILYRYLFETNRFARAEYILNTIIFVLFINLNHYAAYSWITLFSVINIIGYKIGSTECNLYIKSAYKRKEVVLLFSFGIALIFSILFIKSPW